MPCDPCTNPSPHPLPQGEGESEQETPMKFGASMFFTDYSMTPAALARALEDRGFDILWAPEHSHIPLSRKTPFVVRRRAAETLLRRDGPVRDADRGGDGDDDAEGRHRRLPDRAARSDPDGEAGGLDRPGLERPLRVRRRQRLEPGRDGEPRHRVRHAPQAGARADRGDEGDLDAVEAGISRRVRRFRPDDGLAETGAEAAPADRRGRRVPVFRAPRHPLRRRLDAAGDALMPRRRCPS